MRVEYIAGHNPDLVIDHGAERMERIDLTQYKTRDDLHKLFVAKGFVVKMEL